MIVEKKKSKRQHPEETLHRAVKIAFDVALPKDAFAFHTPNGGGRSKAEAGIFKALGVKAGVPDWVIFYRGAAFCIELKAMHGTLTPNQRATHEALRGCGIRVEVARTLQEVRDHVISFGIPLRARIAA